jgi:hypothetical protein
MSEKPTVSEFLAEFQTLTRPFEPCIEENSDLGLTTYYHEDVAHYAHPMTPYHGVDALLAMDDKRLVGVNFWRPLCSPDKLDRAQYRIKDLEAILRRIRFRVATPPSSLSLIGIDNVFKAIRDDCDEVRPNSDWRKPIEGEVKFNG